MVRLFLELVFETLTASFDESLDLVSPHPTKLNTVTAHNKTKIKLEH
jgi:hypothetical protein